MGSGSHPLLSPQPLPHALELTLCSLWPLCYSCDVSSSLLPRAFAHAVCSSSGSPHHAGLCSEFTFQKALSDIGKPHQHSHSASQQSALCFFLPIFYRCACLFAQYLPHSTSGKLLKGGNLSPSLWAPPPLCSHLHFVSLQPEMPKQRLCSLWESFLRLNTKRLIPTCAGASQAPLPLGSLGFPQQRSSLCFPSPRPTS